MKKNVLFICTGNSVRSQMAHALFNHATHFQHSVFSGGVKPYKVHELTKKVMTDINISMMDHTSNHVEEYLDVDFDYVIVLCEMAFLSIPKFKGEYKLLKWFIDDPIRVIGSTDRKEKAFTFTREIIKRKIENFIKNENL